MKNEKYVFTAGDLSKDFEPSMKTQDAESFEPDSPAEQSSLSSSGTDTTNTPKTVVPASERSLNDAMLNDTSVVSSDTSLSSISDLSGSTSFHDTSIAFSSTCIKPPSDMTLPSDSTLEFEGVNDSVSVAKVQ